MPDMEFFCRLRRYTAKNFHMSRQVCEVAESKISAGPSRITHPAELNEMVQYYRDGWGAVMKDGVRIVLILERENFYKK